MSVLIVWLQHSQYFPGICAREYISGRVTVYFCLVHGYFPLHSPSQRTIFAKSQEIYIKISFLRWSFSSRSYCGQVCAPHSCTKTCCPPLGEGQMTLAKVPSVLCVLKQFLSYEEFCKARGSCHP